jgi:hypothetical protein
MNKTVLFLSLLATLIFLNLNLLKMTQALATEFIDARSLQNQTKGEENKFQEAFGCKYNSTCVGQLQNFPFVLPFP